MLCFVSNPVIFIGLGVLPFLPHRNKDAVTDELVSLVYAPSLDANARDVFVSPRSSVSVQLSCTEYLEFWRLIHEGRPTLS